LSVDTDDNTAMSARSPGAKVISNPPADEATTTRPLAVTKSS